jgi:large subunit ribosomal protein L4
MQVAVRNLAAEEVGAVELPDAIFGVEVRTDILHRVVLWQLAKRRAGTHKVKTRAEIWRTGAKLYKQKGTGRARHGSRRPNIFRGGGVAHGPHPRDHSTDLPKKVRALGLKCALSSKAKEGKLVVLDEARLAEPRTKALAGALGKLGWGSALIVTGAEVERNFGLASRNLIGIDVLPSQGLNVYDILRCDTLVLTREAVQRIEERFGAANGAADEVAEGPAAAPMAEAPAEEAMP